MTSLWLFNKNPVLLLCILPPSNKVSSNIANRIYFYCKYQLSHAKLIKIIVTKLKVIQNYIISTIYNTLSLSSLSYDYCMIYYFCACSF